jgi:hypothetical protein
MLSFPTRPASWICVPIEQAIIIAEREGAKIHGLHVLDSKEKAKSEKSLAVQATFDQRWSDADVDGKLIIEPGEISK